jgi:hypothetical protein
LLVEVLSDRQTGDEEGIYVEDTVGAATGLRWPARATAPAPGCDHRKRRTSMACHLKRSTGGAAQKPNEQQLPRTVSLSGKFQQKRSGCVRLSVRGVSRSVSTTSCWSSGESQART